MTAPLRGPLQGTPSLSALPASQTAPVAEFRCLYTHDIRRKQKRWQDGYLKFHTFNNRVMVYDTTRSFLGDTYWKESDAVQEGDELTLDKGVMVEVADAVGVMQTDLTPLFDKAKESSPQNKPAHPPRPLARPGIPLGNPLRASSQLRHKSLNALLGTPRGPIGKALPVKSPYEQRKEKEEQENEWVNDRAVKRQKVAHVVVKPSSPIRDDTGTKKDTSYQVTTANEKNVTTLSRPVPRAPTIINLDSEPDNISSDITLPSTPPAIQHTGPQSSFALRSVSNNPVAPKHVVAQVTPKLPRGKVPLPHLKAKETPPPLLQPSSPPVSASNRLTNVDFALQPAKEPKGQSLQVSRRQHRKEPFVATTESRDSGSEKRQQKGLASKTGNGTVRAVQDEIEVRSQEPTSSQSPPRHPKAKSLRLSKGTKRGVLLCQSLPQERPRTPSEPRMLPLGPKQRTILPEQELIHIPSDDDEPLIRRGSLETRKAPSTRQKRNIPPTKDNIAKRAKTMERFPISDNEFDDDMELMHGLLDQHIIVSPLSAIPRSATRSTPPPTTDLQSRAVKKIHAKGTSLENTPQAMEEPQARVSNPTKRAKQYSKPNTAKPTTAPQHPQNPCPDLVSKPHRNASTSPRKVASSTGGFRKKAPRTGTTASEAPIEHHPITTALPPHPLRANKPGPLMSTRELSALLQKQAPPEDPIDDTQTSPGRKIQRSRSENDAPIPSTSEEWERRNLSNGPEQETPTPPSRGADPRMETRQGTGNAHPGIQQHKPKPSGLAALIKRTDPRKKFLRTQSLNVDMGVGSEDADAESEIMSPVLDTDVGAWSTEAFDLFDWRPPAKEGENRGIGILVDGR